MEFQEDLQAALGCPDLTNATCVGQHMSVAGFNLSEPTAKLAARSDAGLILRRKTPDHQWNYLLCDWVSAAATGAPPSLCGY